MAELPPYLSFRILFETNELPIEYTKPFRKQFCHTNPSMLNNLPDLNRLRRVSGKFANEAMHLNSGRTAYNALKEIALEESVKLSNSDTRILDWGCGCGRVASHFINEHDALIVGVDIDEDNISWCKENLRGEFATVKLRPPTSMRASTFDMIYSCSVLSHLSRRQISEWLKEIARLLSDSGVALLSFNGTSNSTHYLSRRPFELRQIYEGTLFDSDLNDDLHGHITDDSYYRATFA
jgi:cyclopropane fatty-acyl-phospholipid synthase-like methyltransferase